MFFLIERANPFEYLENAIDTNRNSSNLDKRDRIAKLSTSGNYFSAFKVVPQGQGQFPWVQSTRDRCETNGRVHVALQRSLDPRSESDRDPRTSPSESDKNKVVRVTKSGISRKRPGRQRGKTRCASNSRNENR